MRSETRVIRRKTLPISVILITILGFAVYSNSLNGKFVLDDELLIEQNAYIRNWANFSKIFTRNIGEGTEGDYHFYRPIQMLSYMTDYSLWKLNVVGYHFTSTLLHILAALALFWLITILYGDWLLSLLTSLLFVVHPIHTEAVSYIAGRADSLALLFMLLCFILYVRKLDSKSISLYILMVVSYVFAVLSRENSLILPVLLLLYHYTFKKKLKLKEFLPVLAIALIYILSRFTVLESIVPHIGSSSTVWQRIPGFFVAATNYIKLLLLPLNLHMEYGNKLFKITDPGAILGLLILFSLVIYAIRKRRVNSFVFFCIAWFFITLLPVSNLYPINAYMAEHWLYVPSIGFFLILAKVSSSIYRTKNFRTPGIVFITGLLCFYSYLTVRQNTYWKEPVVFYERTMKHAPDRPGMYNNLGTVYYASGRFEEAVAAYRKAIEIKPDYADVYSNLGIVCHDMGKVEEAMWLLKKAVEIDPNYAKGYYNLGKAYGAAGKLEEAMTAYRKAIEINPQYAKAYYNSSTIYFHQKRYELAIEYCDKAKELGLTNPALLEALKPYR